MATCIHSNAVRHYVRHQLRVRSPMHEQVVHILRFALHAVWDALLQIAMTHQHMQQMLRHLLE